MSMSVLGKQLLTDRALMQKDKQKKGGKTKESGRGRGSGSGSGREWEGGEREDIK